MLPSAASVEMAVCAVDLSGTIPEGSEEDMEEEDCSGEVVVHF